MASPHISTNFADILDPRFQKIFYEELPQNESMIAECFDILPSNGRDTYRMSNVGTLPDWSLFTGTVDYASSNLGYNSVITYLEFTSGIQVERKLFDDDQFGIMDERPKALATALARTKEKHGARVFSNAFSVDTLFEVNSEAVAICSGSHTTTSGASTSSGFSNRGTAPLSAAGVATARINMRKFLGDQAEQILVVGDELWIPVDRYEEAFEIVESMGKVDTNLNNRNVHEGVYTIKEWRFMSDTNDWFMVDSKLRTKFLKWITRVEPEFAMAEDIDTLIAKWRGYTRYGWGHGDWRWVYGNQVT